MNLNPMALPNVSLHSKYTDKVPTSAVKVHFDLPELQSLLWELASKMPLWRFKITRGGCYKKDEPENGITHVLSAMEFSVTQDDELLGSVSAGYHGHSKKIFVQNERIKKQRSSGRNDGKMVTADPKRAYREIIKNFYRKHPHEVAQEATSVLAHKISSISQSYHRKVYEASNQLQVTAGKICVAHMELIQQLPIDAALKQELTANFNTAVSSKESHVEALRMAKTLDTPAKGESAVVVSFGSSYVLAYKGLAQVIPSDELPEELRAPLGMLKLSEDNTLIDGIGVRVDNKVFLVVPTPTKGDSKYE